MKTLLTTLLIAASFTIPRVSATQAETDPARKPAKVASFQTGMYTTAEGKLNIALDKQTVGTIDGRLINEKNKVLYDQLIGKKTNDRSATARFKRTARWDLPGAYQQR